MTRATDIAHNYAEVGEVMLHYVTAGKGPPVVLLHGWPQTWYEWRHVIPALTKDHTVIAPDMRGLGDSSRPLEGYDKKTVANDIWRLVSERLGLTSLFLVGHDWGGPTAFALAAAHPEAIRRLVIIDVVIPGDGGDFSQGGRRWHHQFHMTPDLPEALVQGRERLYLQWFYQTFAYKPGAISDADLDEFVRTYSQPGALRSGFNFYRALPQDARGPPGRRRRHAGNPPACGAEPASVGWGPAFTAVDTDNCGQPLPDGAGTATRPSRHPVGTP